MRKKMAFQLGAIGVMAVALVILSIPLLKGGGNARKQRASHAAPAPSPTPTLGKMNFLAPTIKLQQIKDDKFYDRLSRVAEALPIDRDPFSFSDTGPKSSREGLDLSGILWEGEKPTAIINQAFFGVGDSNGQFSVIKILQDRVVLKDSTGEFELRLKQ